MFSKIMSPSSFQFVKKLNAIHKLVLSGAVALIVYFISTFYKLGQLAHIILGWDVFSTCLLVFSWITFYTTPPGKIREQARRQDDSRIVIFFLILIATCISMLAVFLMLISNRNNIHAQVVNLSLAIPCMVFSWALVHTVFTTRYAHLYYADHETTKETHAGGLDFPGEKRPDFVDFAYFSFTLGMTFQVSDVEIVSRRLRRLALGHGLLSFGYNATIIALTVNIVAGLTKS
jgi:uncharacterized membrane protein